MTEKLGLLGTGILPKYNGKDYSLILQNNATNEASQLNSKRNSKKRPFNQKETVYKDIRAIFKGVSLGVKETQLLDYIVVKHTQQGNHDNNTKVTFKLKEYMKDRGLKDAKSARNSLKKGLSLLVSIQISYSGGSKNNPYNQSFGTHNIFTGYDYNRGVASISFTPEVNSIVTKQAMPMPYHKLLFRLDPKKDAASWYILRRLLVNKRMNYGQKRADVMKIATLLEGCPNIPSYKKVINSNDKHVGARIIKPFLDAVEKIHDAIDYTYIDAEGKPFKYEEGLSYKEFSEGSLIVTEWINYPDEFMKQLADTRKKERKKKRKKKAKKE